MSDSEAPRDDQALIFLSVGRGLLRVVPPSSQLLKTIHVCSGRVVTGGPGADGLIGRGMARARPNPSGCEESFLRPCCVSAQTPVSVRGSWICGHSRVVSRSTAKTERKDEIKSLKVPKGSINTRTTIYTKSVGTHTQSYRTYIIQLAVKHIALQGSC